MIDKVLYPSEFAFLRMSQNPGHKMSNTPEREYWYNANPLIASWEDYSHNNQNQKVEFWYRILETNEIKYLYQESRLGMGKWWDVSNPLDMSNFNNETEHGLLFIRNSWDRIVRTHWQHETAVAERQ